MISANTLHVVATELVVGAFALSGVAFLVVLSASVPSRFHPFIIPFIRCSGPFSDVVWVDCDAVRHLDGALFGTGWRDEQSNSCQQDAVFDERSWARLRCSPRSLAGWNFPMG